MKKIKKNKLLCIGFIVFIIIIAFLIKKVNKPCNVVLPALDRAYAEGMVKENECYIVRVANPYEFGTGGWYYMDGQEKKKMYLTGRNPAHELSYVFVDSDYNSFLVKGKMEEELSQYDKCPILYVEGWYIIAPIKRKYGPKQYRKEQRLFYPKDFIDTYDLEQGDYVPLDNQDN